MWPKCLLFGMIFLLGFHVSPANANSEGPSQADLSSSESVSPLSSPKNLNEAGLNEAGLNEAGGIDSPVPDQASKSQGGTTKYECISQGSKLLTVAHTPRGIIPLIEWQSTFFGAQWTPELRCKAISARFQAFSDQNVLGFVSTGVLNTYPIICVSEEYGDCLSNGLLMTLEPQENSTQVLQALFNIKTPIVRGGPKAIIDMEYFLQEKPPLEPTQSQEPIQFQEPTQSQELAQPQKSTDLDPSP